MTADIAYVVLAAALCFFVWHWHTQLLAALDKAVADLKAHIVSEVAKLLAPSTSATPPASSVTHTVTINGAPVATPVPAPLPKGVVGVDAPPPLTYTDYPPALPCTLDANGVISGGGLQLDQYGRLKSGFLQAEYLGENLTNKLGAMRAAFGNGGTIPEVATAAWMADLNRLGFANGLGMAEASIAAAAACTGPTPQYYVTLATQTGAAMTPPVVA